MNMIMALTRAIILMTQFSILLLEVPNPVLGMANITTFDERCWHYVVKLQRTCL